jgi:hypothetical protein
LLQFLIEIKIILSVKYIKIKSIKFINSNKLKRNSLNRLIG